MTVALLLSIVTAAQCRVWGIGLWGLRVPGHWCLGMGYKAKGMGFRALGLG